MIPKQIEKGEHDKYYFIDMFDRTRSTQSIWLDIEANCRNTGTEYHPGEEIRIDYGPEVTIGIDFSTGEIQYFISYQGNIVHADWL
jgi:hypothetical protein